MPNWAPDFLSEAAFQVILTLAVAVVIAALEKLRKKSTWALTAIYFLVSLTCMTFLMDRFWKPSDRVQIRSWLDNSGFKITTKTNEQAEFYFVAEDTGGINANVYKQVGKPYIVFDVKMVSSDEERGLIKALSAQQRALMFTSLRASLIQFGVSYSGADGDLAQVGLQHIVSAGVAEVEFMRHLLFIRSAATLYRNLLASELTKAGAIKLPEAPQSPQPTKRDQ